MDGCVRWFAVFALALGLAQVSGAESGMLRPARLRFDPQFILEEVARHLAVPLEPGAPVPAILLESRTPLWRFQDAVEPQWGFRPRAFTNAYVIARNEIYLTDDARLYLAHGRTLDDSLAHEFVHYLQRSRGEPDLGSERSEAQAVSAQHWFRAAFPPARARSRASGHPAGRESEASAAR